MRIWYFLHQLDIKPILPSWIQIQANEHTMGRLFAFVPQLSTWSRSWEWVFWQPKASSATFLRDSPRSSLLRRHHLLNECQDRSINRGIFIKTTVLPKLAFNQTLSGTRAAQFTERALTAPPLIEFGDNPQFFRQIAQKTRWIINYAIDCPRNLLSVRFDRNCRLFHRKQHSLPRLTSISSRDFPALGWSQDMSHWQWHKYHYSPILS